MSKQPATTRKRGFFARMFGRKPDEPVQNQQRQYTAASHSFMQAGWANQNQSSDALVHMSLPTLRSRSRDLARNNTYMRRFMQMVKTNVVGPAGFKLQAQVVQNDGKPDALANKAIEAAFDAWCRPKNCDVTAGLSFSGLCRLLMEAVARDGEALVRHVQGFDNEFGYALQVLDIDRLDVLLNRPASGNQHAIRMGVELNAYSRPVAYWLKKDHPGDGVYGSQSGDYERVPASELTHIMIADRPEQRRGVPWTHAAIIAMNDLGGYNEAAIVAARVGAAHMGFFVNKNDEFSDTPPLSGGYEGGDFVHEAVPGAFNALPKGFELQEYDPKYPHENFDVFMKACLRSIASGLGVAYHTLANDLEGVNFSSIRSGVLEERDYWMTLQDWFQDAFLVEVYERWLRCALLKGAITSERGVPFPAAKYALFCRYKWQGRRWQWVDPLKDVKAQAEAVALRVKSRRDVASEMGYDFDDTIEQLEAEQAMLTEKGLMVSETTASTVSVETEED